MSIFSSPSKRQVDTGIALLRIVVGTIFAAHGAQKLFVFGFDGVTGAFTQMGIPMAGILGPFVALLEFFGGLALVVGLLTRLAALGLAFNMTVAILQVHLKNGFFAPAGVELALSLLGSTLFVAIAGAGRWSVDALIGRKTANPDYRAERESLRRAA